MTYLNFLVLQRLSLKATCTLCSPCTRPRPERQTPYPMYCSDLLNFLARYFAEALLGILTMDSSLP